MITLRGEIDKNDLEFVTLRYGRPIVAMPAPFKKGRVSPTASRFLLKDKRLVSVFHCKPIYYLHQNGEWRPLYEVTSYYGNRSGMTLKEGWESKIDFGYLAWYAKSRPITIEVKQGKLIKPLKLPLYLNTVTTFFPASDATDGYIGRLPASEIFSTIRGGAGTNTGQSSEHEIGLIATTTDPQYSWLTRFLMMYDSSSIGDTDTIDSGTVSVKRSADAQLTALGNFQANISAGQAASTTAIVAGDYDLQVANATKMSNTSIAYGSMSASTYQDWALNASGLANVSKVAPSTANTLSKFCFRFDDDTDNTADEVLWASAAQSQARIFSADRAGTGDDPKMVITHTTPAAATAVNLGMLLMGVG